MRAVCIPLLMMAALLVQAQSDPLVSKPAGNLYIPAELAKTVRADKAHRGDPVEFITVEAVLLGPKLVMPAQTKLFGRIVGAAPRQANKPSWIVVLVEMAAWKQYRVPLHAFISGQMTLQRTDQNSSSADTPAVGHAGRISGRTGGETGPVPSLSPFPHDQTETEWSHDQAVEQTSTLKDVRIVRDKNGMTYLVSAKRNVKLPGGTLFVLQNHAPAAPDHSATSQPH